MGFTVTARVACSSSAAAPPSSAKRGAFVVLEGLDRSGKSTQCALLVDALRRQGTPAEALRFPDRGTPVGREIDKYLASAKDIDMETVHKLFSQNRWEKKDQMEQLLLCGTTLVVDRYAFSGVAYSAAKGLDAEWCKMADSGLLAPDLVIFLSVSPEAAATRGDYGGERYEKLEFQRLVAEEYRKLQDDTWTVIDASGPLDGVSESIMNAVQGVVTKCQNDSAQPPKLLWVPSSM